MPKVSSQLVAGAILGFTLLASAALAQYRGARATIRIEAPLSGVTLDDGAIEGETRFAHRTELGDGLLLVDVKPQPYVPSPPTNEAAPPVAALQGRPDDQAAFDAQARPGDFVTPPAATR